MPNVWDHLPNAKHIDAIIESVSLHEDVWNLPDLAYEDDAVWDSAWKTAHRLVSKHQLLGLYYVATGRTSGSARVTAWDAILTLIACDDCGYMLDSDPSELEMIAKFGDYRSILLLPSCRALARIKEKTHV